MYRVKARHLKPIHREALELRKRIPRVEAHHVLRGENNHADELANRAIDERAPIPSWLRIDHLLPSSD
jgi:ribonuclease HI